ncbi:hypothetical protein CW700_06710 [Candidatus Bathyarchaeota archaeon]|nr:MAG: hypothetical protein CW700_06710 [Candidatus Bathyarchaeota archaeon]
MTPDNPDISEKELELIEKIARWIVDKDLEGPAVMILQTIKPLSNIGGDLGLFYLAPFLPFLEDKGYRFLETFGKMENIERLIRRIEWLNKEKYKEKRENTKEK